MSQDGRRPSGREHPPWCALTNRDHDPHESARHRIEDAGSFTMIEAYLTKLDHDTVREPLATLELHYPSDEPATFLLTLDQVRRLRHTLDRLLTTVRKA